MPKPIVVKTICTPEEKAEVQKRCQAAGLTVSQGIQLALNHLLRTPKQSTLFAKSAPVTVDGAGWPTLRAFQAMHQGRVIK